MSFGRTYDWDALFPQIQEMRTHEVPWKTIAVLLDMPWRSLTWHCQRYGLVNYLPKSKYVDYSPHYPAIEQGRRDGLSWGEIATRLGLSRNAMKVHVDRRANYLLHIEPDIATTLDYDRREAMPAFHPVSWGAINQPYDPGE
jgi:hypothetical protein